MAGERPTDLQRAIAHVRADNWSAAKSLYPCLRGHESTREWVAQHGLSSPIEAERRLAVILLDGINDWPERIVHVVETMCTEDPSEKVREHAQMTRIARHRAP